MTTTATTTTTQQNPPHAQLASQQQQQQPVFLSGGSSTLPSSSSVLFVEENRGDSNYSNNDKNNNSFVDEQWQKAVDMLNSNPSLVTNHILCMTLKRRPPPHVVRLMLQLNPQAAAGPFSSCFPSGSPTTTLEPSTGTTTTTTPLHIAVQHLCSYEVIRQLIQACPWALVVKEKEKTSNTTKQNDDSDDGGEATDADGDTPLSYAKRFRSEETDLIQLLSLPISHWIKNSSSTNDNGTATTITNSSRTDSSNNNNKAKHDDDDGEGDNASKDSQESITDDSTQAATNLSSSNGSASSCNSSSSKKHPQVLYGPSPPSLPPMQLPPARPHRLLSPPRFNFCVGPNNGVGEAVSSPETIPLPTVVPARASILSSRGPPPATSSCSSSAKVTVASLLASSFAAAASSSTPFSMETSSISSINAVQGDYHKKTTYHGVLPPSERQPHRQPHQQQQHQQLLLLDQQDRVEFANVKHMAVSLVKGHKRLYKQVHTTLPAWVQNQMEEQFRIQSMAFDMREQAMRATFLRRVQDQVLEKVKQEFGLESLLEQVKQVQQQQQQVQQSQWHHHHLKNNKDHQANRALVEGVQEELTRLRLEFQTWHATTVARLEKLEQQQEQNQHHRFQRDTNTNNVNAISTSASSSWDLVVPPSSSWQHHNNHSTLHPSVGWQQLPQRAASTLSSSPCTVTTSSSSSSLPNANNNSNNKHNISSNNKTKKTAKKGKKKQTVEDYDEDDNVHYDQHPIVYFEISNKRGSGIGDDIDEVRSLLSEDDFVLYEKRRGWLIPKDNIFNNRLSTFRCIKEAVKCIWLHL